MNLVRTIHNLWSQWLIVIDRVSCNKLQFWYLPVFPCIHLCKSLLETLWIVGRHLHCKSYVLDFFFLTVAVNNGFNTDQEHSQHQSQPPSYSSLFPTISGSRLAFKDGEVYFHSDLSEKLLTTLSEKGKLSDLTMTLFDSSTTSLR